MPVRISSYDSGALLLHVLRENKISFNTEFDDKTFVEELIKNVLPTINPNDNLMGQYITSYFNNAKTIIDNSITNNHVILEKRVKLLGVNVYDAIYIDGHIISNYFVMYEDDVPVVLYGNFVIETPSEGIITKIYRID